MGITMLVVTLYMLSQLAFVVAGIVILAKDTRISRLEIADCIWLLAAFCLSHGIYDGLKLYTTVASNLEYLAEDHIVTQLRYPLLGVTYFFLIAFGAALMRHSVPFLSRWKPHFNRWATVLVSLGVAVCIVYGISESSELLIRRALALPACLFAGASLIVYSLSLRERIKAGAVHFRRAGIILIVFGLLSSLMLTLSSGHLFTYTVLASRALCALLIAYFVLRAMSIFDLEQIDILEERLARFAQTEKLTALGRLAAGVAHEINNPLTNASLNIEMLQESLDVNSPLQKRATTISANIHRAATIAQELLHVSRDASRDTFETVDIVDVIERSIRLIQVQPQLVKIETEYNAHPEVSGIAWKLEEVFINLLINAIDASDSDAPIHITVDTVDRTALIKITDHGEGIDPAAIDKIFDPFFTTKEPGKGTGLGLSVCYAIIQNHQGDIECRSQKGQGTTFTIVLPRE